MRMLWYSGLYTGKKADLHRADVIRQIRDGKSFPWVYVVTPASNRENILDIYRADDLKNPAYRGREFLILGVADGYQEALEVAAGIVVFGCSAGTCCSTPLQNLDGIPGEPEGKDFRVLAAENGGTEGGI